jgi:hypothetical protein
MIGACTLSYKLNGSNATVADLTAAGITINTTGGVITSTWDGVTGSPVSLEVTVTPSYSINTLAARIDTLLVNSPFIGAKSFVDGLNYDPYQHSPFSGLPWVVSNSQQPTISIGLQADIGE